MQTDNVVRLVHEAPMNGGLHANVGAQPWAKLLAVVPCTHVLRCLICGNRSQKQKLQAQHITQQLGDCNADC